MLRYNQLLLSILIDMKTMFIYVVQHTNISITIGTINFVYYISISIGRNKILMELISSI